MSFREDFRDYALAFDGAWLDHSWDVEGDVYKTAQGKIFLICAGAGAALSVTMKLSADEAAAALTLPFVRAATWPRGWVTAAVSSDIERDIALDWASRGYELVSSPPARRAKPSAP
jgi:predicted DNA-binding protein (MmcQ/YjbR family)